MMFKNGSGNTTIILLGSNDYDLNLNLADFIEKFRMEWSVPIFHRVSVKEVAILSMVSKTLVEKRFSRNKAFAKCSGNGLNGLELYCRAFISGNKDKYLLVTFTKYKRLALNSFVIHLSENHI